MRMGRPGPSRVRTQRKGAALVEMALVLGLLLALVFGIIEFGSAFFLRQNMLHAAREAARTLAVKEATAAEAIVVAQDHLANIAGVDFTITVTEPDPNVAEDHDVVVAITAPLSQAALGDPLGVLGDGTLEVEVTMRKEG